MTAAILSVENLSVTFGHGRNRNEAVKNLSYTLGKGETLAVNRHGTGTPYRRAIGTPLRRWLGCAGEIVVEP